MSTEAKNRKVFIILAVLLGAFGIHNFYVGDTKKGLLKLALLAVILIVKIFPLAVWLVVWPLIEASTQKQDANGVPMA